MGTKLPLIVIITIIHFQSILSFERIFLKSFTDPSTTRTEDFWQIQDLDENPEDYIDYLKCKNDRYFGPFQQGYKIWREQIMLSPFHEL